MVAEPAEGAHRLREGDPGEQEREPKPRRVDREQDRALDTVLVAASTRIDASTAPMHGAAHTAKPHRAAGSSTRRAPVSRPGREQPFGPGQQADEREPDDDEDEARELELAVGRENAADRGRRVPSATKTTVKPRTKGRLASATRRATPGCPRRSASTAETAER